MQHLPAYVAASRFVSGRRVLVIRPLSAAGPRLLLAAGAREVVALGGDVDPEPGLEHVDAPVVAFPVRDQTIDLVIAVEVLPTLRRDERHALLREARRVLRNDGLFVGWVMHQGAARGSARERGTGTATIDFWTLEDELRRTFGSVAMIAQMPWSGVSLAPIADDDGGDPEPGLRLVEDLLESEPVASHYVAFASRIALPSAIARECLLVPQRGDERGPTRDLARAEALSDEVERLREELGVRAARAVALQRRVADLEAQVLELERGQRQDLDAELAAVREALLATEAQLSAAQQREHDAVTKLRAKETDLVILERASVDHEQSLSRVQRELEERRRELEQVRVGATDVSGRIAAIEAEREELRRQLDALVSERESSRIATARLDAELDLARRRLREQEEQLASKSEEVSRLSGTTAAIRERLEQADSQLAETRSRAEKLSAQVEQGRMLADVALDRDRMREELATRRQQVQKLEERVWQARDALQREKIEAVRASGELERVREQLERSRQVERERASELEAVGRQLRETELQRAELAAMLKVRDERIASLQQEAAALAGRSEGLDVLRERLTEREEAVAELSSQLAQTRQREAQAMELARRRERELSDAGERLLTLQRALDDSARLSAGLQADLDVRGLEAEELSAVVRNLQREAEDQREVAARLEKQRLDLQAKLEEAAIEQQGLRAQLRAREQELDDIISTQESNALELFKLRRELEDVARTAESRAAEKLPDDQKEFEGWPAAARTEVLRLREEVARLREAASERDALEGDLEKLRSGGAERTRRLALEAKIRAEEQERMLADLDASAQRIWEMTDAADRNAARFAASLAQLEVQKTKVVEQHDEIDVLRNLLAAEQARALEQERMLASERAKLARAGLDVGGMIATSVSPEDIEDVFAGLGEPGARLQAPSPAASGAFAWADAAASVSLPIDDALADLDLGDVDGSVEGTETTRPVSASFPAAGSGSGEPHGAAPASARSSPTLGSAAAPVAASLSGALPSRVTLGDVAVPLQRETQPQSWREASALGDGGDARTDPRTDPRTEMSRNVAAGTVRGSGAVREIIEDRAPGSGSRPLRTEGAGASSRPGEPRARMVVELVDEDDDGAWEVGASGVAEEGGSGAAGSVAGKTSGAVAGGDKASADKPGSD